MPPPPPAWQSGLDPVPLPRSGASQPVMGAIIVAMLLVVTLSLRHCSTLLVSLARDMVQIRSHAKNFTEHTANESRLIMLFGVQVTVYTALMLQVFGETMTGITPFSGTFAPTLHALAIAAVWWLWQPCMYKLMCYAFATGEQTQQYMRGFSAQQSLLGFALALPAVVAVFYPSTATTMLVVGAILYILFRIIFIYKGFRIFYHNFLSWIYFILYLCALEITPVIIILAIATVVAR